MFVILDRATVESTLVNPYLGLVAPAGFGGRPGHSGLDQHGLGQPPVARVQVKDAFKMYF